ncbi:HEAT repeat domain-containing protein [Nonomuraea sp. NPDC050451]|uniref:HEAT repeat domain-containing protein n=1 Tax=Nonomuraea sp. NPDC050451 TaxID=3364364 RepID=UPI00378B8824
MTVEEDLFAGLDEIRWGRMRHAYGSAAEVPGLLRDLIDSDPAVRESALDGMYGAVHHQGDVYPCTIAAIPFLLRIAERPELPGRPGVVELLASMGSAEDPTELSGPYRKANEAVAAAYPLWERLLADADPRVREGALEVLPACTRRRPEALARLAGRLADETDEHVRRAIVRTAGTLARCEEGVDPALRDWLAGIVAAEPDLQLRLVALAELASLPGAPDEPPVAEVDDALEMLAAVYGSGTAVTAPAGFETGTLIGAVRRLREQDDEGRRAPGAAALVRDLSASFGDRVDDRVRLLAGLLRSRDWERHLDALTAAGNLVDDWRGDYRELIGLVGERIGDGHPRTRPRAVGVLEHLGELTAPAADALAAALESTTRRASHTEADAHLPWVIEWSHGLPTVSPALRALSGTGDPRALPMLAWALDREPMPNDPGSCVIRFGPRAVPLMPLLLRRLRDLPADDPHDHRRDSVARALAAIGPAATEALPDLLGGPVTPAVLVALAAIDPDAGECLPVLRQAAAAADHRLAVPAARALWQVTGSADAALAVADRCLDDDSTYAWREAADLLAELGQATKSQSARLRRLARRKDPHGWLVLSAAHALWRITGDPAPALPVLERVWTANVHTRPRVAALWAELGPVAADSVPLLTAELGRARRHNAREDGYSTAQVTEDETLLGHCRAALTAVGGYVR